MRWGLLVILGVLGALVANAHPHNSIEVLKGPRPVFPEKALVPGRCEVDFEVFNYTEISVTGVSCTSEIYCAPARDSVLKVELRVVDNEGEEGEGIALRQLYPLEFLFENGHPLEKVWMESLPLKPCGSDLIS